MSQLMWWQRPREDAAAIIGMQRRGAVLVAAAFVIACFVILLMTMPSAAGKAWSVVFLVACALQVAILLLAPGDPLPRRWAGALLTLGGVQAAVTLPFIPIALPQPVILGPLTGAAAAAGALAGVRGRFGIGCALVVMSLCAMGVWSAVNGETFLHGASYGVANIAVMVMAGFFARVLRPAAALIFGLRKQAARQTAIEAAVSATAAERRRQLERVDTLARPMLETIERAGELTPAQRQEAVLTAARLRDGIRARGLDSEKVATAAWEARRRGVTVRLLDDHGLTPDEVAPVFLDACVAALEAAESGEVVIRLNPADRPVFASIVTVSPAGAHRREYDSCGAII